MSNLTRSPPRLKPGVRRATFIPIARRSTKFGRRQGHPNADARCDLTCRRTQLPSPSQQHRHTAEGRQRLATPGQARPPVHRPPARPQPPADRVEPAGRPAVVPPATAGRAVRPAQAAQLAQGVRPAPAHPAQALPPAPVRPEQAPPPVTQHMPHPPARLRLSIRHLSPPPALLRPSIRRRPHRPALPLPSIRRRPHPPALPRLVRRRPLQSARRTSDHPSEAGRLLRRR
jgi:hypothetical protein